MPQSGEQLGGWWLRGAQRTGWLVTGPAQSQSSASCPRVHTSPQQHGTTATAVTQEHTNNTVIPPWPPSEPASSSSSPAWPPPRQSSTTKVR